MCVMPDQQAHKIDCPIPVNDMCTQLSITQASKSTHPILQCAAVSTQNLFITVPPQMCRLLVLSCIETMYLIECGTAAYPPTMRKSGFSSCVRVGSLGIPRPVIEIENIRLDPLNFSPP